MKRQINQNVGHMPVQSTSMRSAGYDEETGDMHVMFNDGKTYVYHDVPPEVYQAYTISGSKGRFLHENIKGNFEFTKL